MKKLFPLNWTPRGRVALLVTLLTATLVCSAFTAAPEAHAAPAGSCGYYGICIVTVWATDVNVRSCLNTNNTLCPVIGTVAGGNENIVAFCQNIGTTVTYGGYTNPWWMEVIADNGQTGWMSNIFIVGGITIDGIPNCNLSAG